MGDAGSDDTPTEPTRSTPGPSPARPLHWSETRARQTYVRATAQEQSAARRTLLVALLVALLVTGIGAVALGPRYFAAQQVAATFCSALSAGDYAAAYALLDPNARGGLSQTSYMAALRTLDTAEGALTNCAAGGLVGYQYTPGQATASDTVTLTRQRATLQGTLGLTYERDGWRITSVATSVYGAPLAPVAVVAAYCAALRTDDYAAGFTLFSVTAQAAQTSGDYVTEQRLRDMLTSHITGCAAIALAMPDPQTLHALLGVTRARGAASGGEMQVQPDGGAWRITQFDPAIEGVDVGPYLVGQAFCADVAAGDFSGVYSLLTSALQAQTTQAELSAALTSAPGAHWRCGQALDASYTVTGYTASYRVPLTSTAPGAAPGQRTETLQFMLINGNWQISGY